MPKFCSALQVWFGLVWLIYAHWPGRALAQFMSPGVVGGVQARGWSGGVVDAGLSWAGVGPLRLGRGGVGLLRLTWAGMRSLTLARLERGRRRSAGLGGRGGWDCVRQAGVGPLSLTWAGLVGLLGLDWSAGHWGAAALG